MNRSSSGSSASTGAGAAEPEPPPLQGLVCREGRLIAALGDGYFEADPAIGGRIVRARVGATELLADRTVHPENFGSTFWPSPQADWHWPPIEAIDSAPYTVHFDGASCTMTSPPVTEASNPRLAGLVVGKRFSVDSARGALVVEYTLRNEGTEPKRVAPWEITRVRPDGLTFFRATTAPWPAPGGALPPLSTGAGCVWFLDSPAVAHHAKLFADGTGWIAHVASGSALLVKAFADLSITEAAPGEAEIEVYAANPPGEPASRYVEVENQGPYEEIPPGGARSWTVRWYLRKVPPNVVAAPGNAELVTFVERLL